MRPDRLLVQTASGVSALHGSDFLTQKSDILLKTHVSNHNYMVLCFEIRTWFLWKQLHAEYEMTLISGFV